MGVQHPEIWSWEGEGWMWIDLERVRVWIESARAGRGASGGFEPESVCAAATGRLCARAGRRRRG
eukprot:1900365-Rhodomonas_salina.1